MVSEMTTGHQLAVTAVGPEGVIGLGPLFSVPRYPLRVVVLVQSGGYRVATERLNRVFERSEALRRLTLTYVGQIDIVKRSVLIAQACQCYVRRGPQRSL